MSTTATSTLDEIGQKIATWASDRFGAEARLNDVKSLGGHSQITVGFELCLPDKEPERLVLKTPPPGVTAQNNFDVLRQVPVLQALEAQGVPAPQARYWSQDLGAFGGPFLMMSRLRGASPGDVFTDEAGRGIVDCERQFGDATRTLVRIHSIGRDRLPQSSVARGVREEIDHWIKVVQKSSDASWVAMAARVRQMLLANAPADVPMGLVHGDYYTNNWVFDGAELAGVVDWEGASIGPVLIDLGWLCMMYDPPSWGPMRRRRMGWHPGPDDFIAWYGAASPLDLSGIDWYRALAAYRLACITAYYYERHRTGKRHNPAWDVLGEAFPHLLQQAAARLDA